MKTIKLIHIITCSALCALTLDVSALVINSSKSATFTANIADHLTDSCNVMKNLGKGFIDSLDQALNGSWTITNMQTINNSSASMNSFKTNAQNQLNQATFGSGCGASSCEIDRLTSNLTVISTTSENIVFQGGLNGDLILRCKIGNTGNTCSPSALNYITFYVFPLRHPDDIKPNFIEVGIYFDPRSNLSESDINDVVASLSSVDKCNKNYLKPMPSGSATFASGNNTL